MEPPKLASFIKTTHPCLPFQRADLDKVGFPFAISVTPFPSDSPPPPLSEYDIKQALVCDHCRSYSSNYSVPCTDGFSWTCSVCQSKNKLPRSFSPDLVQHQFPMVTFPVNKGQYPQLSRMLLVENNTKNNDIYQKTIADLREAIKSCNPGVYSFGCVGKYITIPHISNSRQTFSILRVTDFESELELASRNAFFQLPDELEVFDKYLDILSKEEPSSSIQPMENIYKFCHMYNPERVYFVAVLANSLPPDIKQCDDLGLASFQSCVHVDVFLCDERNITQEFRRFTMESNAHLTILNPDVRYFMTAEVLNRFFSYHGTNSLFMIKCPKGVYVDDIAGSGLRKAENTYTEAFLHPDDAIYIRFMYSSRRIGGTSPVVQIQHRYIDPFGNTVIQIFNQAFRLSNTTNDVFFNMDTKAVFASSLHFGFSPLTLKDSVQRPIFASFDTKIADLMRQRFMSAECFMETEDYFGRRPKDVARIFYPPLYLHTENGFKRTSFREANPLQGVYFIKRESRKGLLMIGSNEPFEMWVQQINQEPFSTQLATVSRGWPIEVQSTSAASVFNYIRKITKLMKSESQMLYNF